MAGIEQVLSYVKQINERLNQLTANAKKTEELPVMETMDPEGLLIVSELADGIWTSKQLEIKKIIEGISLSGQDNKIREVLLGTITVDHDLNYLLDNNGITVAENEIIILTALATVNSTLIQKQYLWKLGKGAFNPIGSANSNTKLIELQPRFISEITAEELTSSPSAIVYDFGVITDTILNVINAASPAYNYTDEEKIYYIRATKDDVNLLYNFIGVNGTYGSAASQMTEADLVLVYSSANVDVTELLNSKLDKGTYTGDAGLIDNRITILEGAQGKANRFTGKSYALWSGTGLIYDVIYTSYYINEVLYPGGTIQKTLNASDPTNPRFDLIAVDATGAIVIEGTASASPEIPTTDPNTQLAISPILVEAGATVPSGVSNENVYKENAEWTTTSNNGTVNFNATSTPFQGTKHIDCGAFSNGQYLKFTEGAVNQIADFSEIGFALNLKATFSNSAKFSVRFYNGTTAVSSVVAINNGAYNFDRTAVNAYQLVIIPLSDFTFSNSSFDRIDIVMAGSNANGFRMDNIIMYKGSGSNSPEQKAITSIITDAGVANATTKDDTFQFKGLGGLVVSAIGKVISFTVNFYTKTEVDTKDAETLFDANAYTDSIASTKLDASAYNDRFKGVYLTEAALNAAHPTANVGDYAQVNEVGATDVVNYNWDGEESIWVKNVTEGGSGATNTDELPEGSTNFYYTAARFIADLTYARIITALGFTPENSVNKSNDAADIASTSKFPVWKVITDWCINRFQPKLVQGTNITIDNTNPLAPVINASGGGGDMTTTTDQTVSGIKTFLNGKLGFRNVANTFTSFFTNANTAIRTYTLPNKDGTVAMTSDILAQLTGTVNYLVKFGTTTTGVVSRLFDNGTFFGIGTVNTPTKDLTLGNQTNKEIGIEESSNTTKGRDLKIKAGRTINFAQSQGFTDLMQISRGWWGTTASNGNIYASVKGGDIYMQTGGTGNFVALGQTARNYGMMASAPNGNIYCAASPSGNIYMQTNGTGSFVSLGLAALEWQAVAVSPNGNVYAAVRNGDIYMQTNGAGAFVALNQTPRMWQGMTSSPNGNVYACHETGDIYMQTNGTGNFVALGQTSRAWYGLACASNGNVYATTYGGDIYMQTSGAGNFVALGQTSRNYLGIASSSTGNIYVVVQNGSIYQQINYNVGTADLDGGALQHYAGTGKGTGKSRYEIWTGQKTTSGTDMQIETLRGYFDENGFFVHLSTPEYANDAAADVDTNLPSGAHYKITGSRQLYQKP